MGLFAFNKARREGRTTWNPETEEGKKKQAALDKEKKKAEAERLERLREEQKMYQTIDNPDAEKAAADTVVVDADGGDE